MQRPTAIERAFQLAKEGRYGSVQSILMALKKEGYSGLHTGPSLRRQLSELIRKTRTTNTTQPSG